MDFIGLKGVILPSTTPEENITRIAAEDFINVTFSPIPDSGERGGVFNGQCVCTNEVFYPFASSYLGQWPYSAFKNCPLSFQYHCLDQSFNSTVRLFSREKDTGDESEIISTAEFRLFGKADQPIFLDSTIEVLEGDHLILLQLADSDGSESASMKLILPGPPVVNITHGFQGDNGKLLGEGIVFGRAFLLFFTISQFIDSIHTIYYILYEISNNIFRSDINIILFSIFMRSIWMIVPSIYDLDTWIIPESVFDLRPIPTVEAILEPFYVGSFNFTSGPLTDDVIIIHQHITNVTVRAEANGPSFELLDVIGSEDANLRLNCSLSTIDPSENLTDAIINRVPMGASFSNGQAMGPSEWTIPGPELCSTDFIPPPNTHGIWNLAVSVATKETRDHQPVSEPIVKNFSVQIGSLADRPRITAKDTVTFEDLPVELQVNVILSDADGSELLTVTIGPFPEGSILDKGVENANFWVISAGNSSEVSNITFTPPAFYSGQFLVNITAVSSDKEASSATLQKTMAITVRAVSNSPLLSVSNITMEEDSSAAISVVAELVDTDGSEELDAHAMVSCQIGTLEPAEELHSDGFGERWNVSISYWTSALYTPPLDFHGVVECHVIVLSRDQTVAFDGPGNDTQTEVAANSTTFFIIVESVIDDLVISSFNETHAVIDEPMFIPAMTFDKFDDEIATVCWVVVSLFCNLLLSFSSSFVLHHFVYQHF